MSAKNGSVALQQKSSRKYASLTVDQLHKETLDARNTLFDKCVDVQTYTANVLLPYCEEVIARYKMQGVAAKDRPNGKPTVEAYFKSINLNYNTVRSWFRRKRLESEMFQPKNSNPSKRGEKTPQLTQLEARLLGTASAGHDLVKAIRQGGNVDAAIKDFEEHAPTPERIEEYIARPAKTPPTSQPGECAVLELGDIRDELLRLADELNVGWDMNAWSEQLNGIASAIDDRIELEKRVGKLKPGRHASIIIRNFGRDRRFSDEMKLILKAGGKTYQGKKIMGNADHPYITRISRKHVKAELTGDLDHRLGCKPDSD